MDSDINRPKMSTSDDDLGTSTLPAWMTPIRPEPSPTAETSPLPKSTPAPLAKPGLPREQAAINRDKTPTPPPTSEPPVPPIQPVHIRKETPNTAAHALPREFAGMPTEDEPLVHEALLYDDERPLAVDPAFVYLIALFITVIGLGGAPLEARLTLGWAGLGISAIAAILLDDVEILRPTPRELLIGVLYGVLVGVPA